ncbi:uncharacterized protein LAESUDRAFT_728988 [Laetiporus sulphureus 93-53]|uniref:DUF6534 domain-containing protein n=1 Tax=Laetiporus sulphureus 93-53 TaxID=1314785 RepID=A0A165CXU8_9APHY|nr:uncharacterized protein LAESUDRAFT_728988 [Laetiporus sulphureus 93-53]KZT03697.1 hypothetical protein LAESUDRAFT_728988 [Laetiporus sulphureus 93-53]
MGYNLFPRNATLGAAYLGTIAASILYGVTNLQAFVYYKRPSHDPYYIRWLVFFLWVLDGLHLAFIIHASYSYTITDYMNAAALMTPLWCIASHVFVSSLSDAIVRGMFCCRIWMLSERKLLMTSTVAFVSFITLASGWAFSVWGSRANNYFLKPKALSYFLYPYFISGVTADVLITAFLCILLHRQRGSLARTNSVVNTLMLYSINTGVLSSLCALLCLLLYTLLPQNKKFAFIAVYFVLPKLLLNSLLASLNARDHLRKMNETGGLVTMPPPRMDRDSVVMHGLVCPQSFEIDMQTTMEMKSDNMSDIALPDTLPRAMHSLASCSV